MSELIKWANPSKEDKEAYELFTKVNNYLFKNGFRDAVIQKFYYLCAEQSEMKAQLEDLLKQHWALIRKTNDRRSKFTSAQKKHMKEVYDTKAGQSIRKTMRLLHKEGIDISERYLYVILRGK